MSSGTQVLSENGEQSFNEATFMNRHAIWLLVIMAWLGRGSAACAQGNPGFIPDTPDPLARFQPEDETAQLLQRLLSSRDGEVREFAAKKLGKLGAKAQGALGALNTLAWGDPSEGVREAAKEALRLIGSGDDKTVRELMALLKSDDPVTRYKAVEDLRKLGTKAGAAAADLKALAGNDSSAEVRQAAGEAARQVGGAKAKRYYVTVYDLGPMRWRTYSGESDAAPSVTKDRAIYVVDWRIKTRAGLLPVRLYSYSAEKPTVKTTWVGGVDEDLSQRNPQ
jgi:HEAT repeats